MRQLPLEKAAWQYPVRLRGVITLYNGLRRKFYVQDDTGGIFIRATGTQPVLHTGDMVEIAGASYAGGYTPVVISTSVSVVDKASLPEAPQVTPLQLNTGQYDSQWVEVHGVVRSLSYDHGLLQLKLNNLEGTVTVDIPATNRQIFSTQSLVSMGFAHPSITPEDSSPAWPSGPHPWNTKIEEPGIDNPFSLPTSPIASVGKFNCKTFCHGTSKWKAWSRLVNPDSHSSSKTSPIRFKCLPPIQTV